MKKSERVEKETCPYCGSTVKAEDMLQHFKACPVEKGEAYREGEVPRYIKKAVKKLLKSWAPL